MDPVVHFEVPGEDLERMKKFYEGAFGWKMQQMGADMGNYVVATTAPTKDPSGRPDTPGMINGGFYKKSDNPLQQHPSFVISVDNLEEAMEKVKVAGGKIMNEPQDIPGVGRFCSFQDTEGNTLSLLQPLMK